MNMEGFKEYTKDEIEILFRTKGDIAKHCIPSDVEFDYALPNSWLNNFRAETGMSVDEILGTTFCLYSDARGLNGVIWSACKELNNYIKLEPHSGY